MHDTSASWSNINFPLTEGKQRRGSREGKERRRRGSSRFQSHSKVITVRPINMAIRKLRSNCRTIRPRGLEKEPDSCSITRSTMRMDRHPHQQHMCVHEWVRSDEFICSVLGMRVNGRDWPGIRIDRRDETGDSEEMSSSPSLVPAFPGDLFCSLLPRRSTPGLVLAFPSHSGSVRRQQRAASSNSRRSLQLSLF